MLHVALVTVTYTVTLLALHVRSNRLHVAYLNGVSYRYYDVTLLEAFNVGVTSLDTSYCAVHFDWKMTQRNDIPYRLVSSVDSVLPRAFYGIKVAHFPCITISNNNCNYFNFRSSKSEAQDGLGANANFSRYCLCCCRCDLCGSSLQCFSKYHSGDGDSKPRHIWHR